VKGTYMLIKSELREVDDFLGMQSGDSPHNLPYSIKKVEDWKYDIEMLDSFVFKLRNQDHDCKAGPDNGCGYCYFLYRLGLIPEGDYEPKDFIYEGGVKK